jgi:tRNA A37 methylthiotransferase MiaB
VTALRQWRALTDGAGVPTIAHGSDFIVGFNAERWTQFLDCCEHSSPVDEGELASA